MPTFTSRLFSKFVINGFLNDVIDVVKEVTVFQRSERRKVLEKPMSAVLLKIAVCCEDADGKTTVAGLAWSGSAAY